MGRHLLWKKVALALIDLSTETGLVPSGGVSSQMTVYSMVFDSSSSRHSRHGEPQSLSIWHSSAKESMMSFLFPVGRAGLLTHSSSFRVIIQVAVSGVLIFHRTCSSPFVKQRFIFMLFSVFSIIALCDVVVIFTIVHWSRGVKGLG